VNFVWYCLTRIVLDNGPLNGLSMLLLLLLLFISSLLTKISSHISLIIAMIYYSGMAGFHSPQHCIHESTPTWTSSTSTLSDPAKT